MGFTRPILGPRPGKPGSSHCVRRVQTGCPAGLSTLIPLLRDVDSNLQSPNPELKNPRKAGLSILERVMGIEPT